MSPLRSLDRRRSTVRSTCPAGADSGSDSAPNARIQSTRRARSSPVASRAAPGNLGGEPKLLQRIHALPHARSCLDSRSRLPARHEAVHLRHGARDARKLGPLVGERVGERLGGRAVARQHEVERRRVERRPDDARLVFHEPEPERLVRVPLVAQRARDPEHEVRARLVREQQRLGLGEKLGSAAEALDMHPHDPISHRRCIGRPTQRPRPRARSGSRSTRSAAGTRPARSASSAMRRTGGSSPRRRSSACAGQEARRSSRRATGSRASSAMSRSRGSSLRSRSTSPSPRGWSRSSRVTLPSSSG